VFCNTQTFHFRRFAPFLPFASQLRPEFLHSIRALHIHARPIISESSPNIDSTVYGVWQRIGDWERICAVLLQMTNLWFLTVHLWPGDSFRGKVAGEMLMRPLKGLEGRIRRLEFVFEEDMDWGVVR
jgi:hypothetical protein